MDAKQNDWSKPDYAAWKSGIREVSDLPTLRFYFAVPIIAVVTIAVSLATGGYGYAAFSIAVLILVFGTTAFLMQWAREGNDRQLEERAAESSDQPDGAEAVTATGETQ
jgi:hypothetical protein